MDKNLVNIGKKANRALTVKIDQKLKNKILYKFGKLINENKSKIIKENKKDIKFAIKKGLKENLIDRLLLNNSKINQIIKSIYFH